MLKEYGESLSLIRWVPSNVDFPPAIEVAALNGVAAVWVSGLSHIPIFLEALRCALGGVLAGLLVVAAIPLEAIIKYGESDEIDRIRTLEESGRLKIVELGANLDQDMVDFILNLTNAERHDTL
jgi:hypothetical protein